MASIETYFPTGIVTGNAFCDREVEREYLKKRFEQNAHVVLISPRRYGKSSLINQFTLDQGLPFASVDLLPATSGKYVKNAMLDGVTSLLNSILPTVKRSKQKIISYFAKMNPVIEVSAFGQGIKLKPDEKTYEETIMKALMNLDEVAKEFKQHLIFVIDEFQQIALLEKAHSLEASIRHAVERSKNVFYIFSGSNRTLLEEMFKNKNRPLYHLCDEMKLNRISAQHYEIFLKKASQKTWKKMLSTESINAIIRFTECHPYYVNRLCRMVWDVNSLPQVEDIKRIWKKYIDSQKQDWVSEMLSNLTMNQRMVLAGLANSPQKELMSKEFASKLELSTSSIQRTIYSLIKNDLVYQDIDDFYNVLNPVVKSVLAEDKYYDFKESL